MRKLSVVEAFFVVLLMGILLILLFPTAKERGAMRPKTEVKQESTPESEYSIAMRHKSMGDDAAWAEWLLKAHLKEYRQDWLDALVTHYLQSKDVQAAQNVLRQSFQAHGKEADLKRNFDLGEADPYLQFRIGRLQSLNTFERAELVNLVIDARRFEFLLAALANPDWELLRSQAVQDAIYLALEKNPDLEKPFLGLLSQLYMQNGDGRYLGLVSRNIGAIPLELRSDWLAELSLMLGKREYIQELFRQLVQENKLSDLLRYGRMILQESQREPGSDETIASQSNAISPVSQDWFAMVAPVWPLDLSSRFLAQSCYKQPAFCQNMDRNSAMSAQEISTELQNHLEILDPGARLKRILSQDPMSSTSPELFLVWNSVGVTPASLAHLLALQSQIDSPRLFSELVEGTLKMGNLTEFVRIMNSQTDSDLLRRQLSQHLSLLSSESTWQRLLTALDTGSAWLLSLAQELALQRQWDKSSALWARAIELDIEPLKARELLAHYLRYIGDAAGSAPHAIEAVTLGSRDPHLLYMAASGLVSEEPSRALTLYHEACQAFQPRDHSEIILAYEACDRSRNHAKAALLAERILVQETSSKWVSAWHEQLLKSSDFDTLRLIYEKLEPDHLTAEELEFWQRVAVASADKVFLKYQIPRILTVDTSVLPSPLPTFVVEEVKLAQTIVETVAQTESIVTDVGAALVIEDAEQLEEELKHQILLSIRKEQETTVREIAAKTTVGEFQVGLRVLNYAKREELIYTVENYDWENFRAGVSDESAYVSIGEDISLSYIKEPVRGLTVALTEDLKVQEVALQFSRKLRSQFEATLKISRQETEGRRGLVESANRGELTIRRNSKANTYQEIRLLSHDQDEFFANRTALNPFSYFHSELLLGKRFDVAGGELDIAIGAGLTSSKAHALLRARFESRRGLGLYYQSFYDPWLRKTVADYGLDWSRNF